MRTGGRSGPARYDHAIVGAGVSGLLLARRLLDEGPDPGGGASGPRLLLVDPDLTTRRSFTVAFWATGPTALDAWTLRSWDRLRIIGHDDRALDVSLAGYRYTAVAWQAARADLVEALRADPRVTMVEAAATRVCDAGSCAQVWVEDRPFEAGWAFDSRPMPAPPVPGQPGRRRRDRRGIELYQTFRGVWVRGDRPCVDTSAATLLDFSADDGPDLGFAYVLPVDSRAAMVMAVRMGASQEMPDPHPAIPRELGGDGWRLEAEERGVTPLLSPGPGRREGRRILAIGRRGGRVRPSTGYAVIRILADTQAIVASLRRHGHPFAVPDDPWRDRALDAIWLHALARERAALEPAFLALFSQAPVSAVLRFLDGEATLAEHVRVIRALPPGPFLRAAGRWATGRPDSGAMLRA